MKNISLYISLFPLAMLGTPELRMVVIPSSLTHYPIQAGSLYVAFAKDSDGHAYNDILIWELDGSGELISINDVSAFDEAARSEIAGLADATDADLLKRTIGRMVSVYAVRGNHLLMAEPQTGHFLEHIRAHVSEEKFEIIKHSLSDPVVRIDETDWTVSLTLITFRGAIEKRIISGAINPFSVLKQEILVLAPSGSIPDCGYVPIPLDGIENKP